MKKSIIFIVAIIFYIFGILSYKFQLPPYVQAKYIFLTLTNLKQAKKNLNNQIINSQFISKKKEILSTYKLIPDFQIVKYSPGMNIWTDRGYYNRLNDNKINELFLIKQNRHNNKNIIIKSKKDLEIIRVSCMINENQNYENWQKIDYNVLIIGATCIHDQVFLKKFKAGEIVIYSGGPISSDPIFINDDSIEIKISR